MQTFPNLVRLKGEEDEAAFYDLLSEVVPEIRKYIIKRIIIAIQKGHFPKNKYVPNDFIDQLFIETYDHIEDVENEKYFYLWLLKKTDDMLQNAIISEEFENLFFKNIDAYSNQEWEQIEENFIAESIGDFIFKEELDDISYHKKLYTINDVFIENTESELVKKIDENLHEEQVDKHTQIIFHNLPLQTRNVFELFTKHHLSIVETTEIY